MLPATNCGERDSGSAMIDTSSMIKSSSKCETFKCYLLNKSNKKAEYVLELYDDVIKVLSCSSRKPKAEIWLDSSHAR